MPFIKGRYHINPIAGEVLEAAREAEAALLALENEARAGRTDGNESGRNADDDSDGYANTQAEPGSTRGPIHRVEIEAEELVPSHAGRAGHGHVARVQRSVAITPQGPTENAASSLFSPRGSTPAAPGAAPRNYGGTTSVAARPETHVFSNHGDLLSFLDDQLSRDASTR